MSAAAPLSRLASKEVRAMAPLWLACVAAMIAGQVQNLDLFSGFGTAVFFFGSAAIAAMSIGHEYQHRTLPMLLSLPIARSRVFLSKMGILAAMLLGVAAVATLVVFPGTAGEELHRPWIAVRIALYILCVAPWLTMVFRSAIAGTVFTLGLPGTAVAVAQVIYLVIYRRIAPVDLVMSILWLGSLILTPIGAVAGWWTFMRLEPVEDRSASVGLPRWRRSTVATAAPALTIGHPIWLLVRKELRLQQMALVVAGFYVFGWAAAVLLQPAFPHAREIFEILSLFYALLMALLTGSLASAEERQLGTLEWQLLLPIAASRQWAVKVGVVIGLTLVLALGLPSWLVTARPALQQLWPRFAGATVTLAVAGLYVSSACGSGLWAMLMSLTTVLCATWWLTYLRIRLSVRLGRTLSLALIRFDTALEPLMATAFVGLLLWFALRNHRFAERASQRLWMQGLWLTGYLTAAVIVAVLAAR
jgi:hypothetical protein